MSVVATGVSWIALALLTTMSSEPKCAAVLSIAVFTDSSSRTSTMSGSARPPAFSISSAALWMVPGSLGCGVSVLAATAMLAPSRAARKAIASPMPREAPVMNSVLPLSDMVRPPCPRAAGCRYRTLPGTLPGLRMPFGSSMRLNAAHQVERDRVLHARQEVALEHADAVLGRDRAAVFRDDAVHDVVHLVPALEELGSLSAPTGWLTL